MTNSSISRQSSVSSDTSILNHNNNDKVTSDSDSSPTHCLSGPKHTLILEADVQVCRLNHTRTIVSKIMNSRYLRRWESHRIVLDPNEIRSTTVSTLFFVYIFVYHYYFSELHNLYLSNILFVCLFEFSEATRSPSIMKFWLNASFGPGWVMTKSDFFNFSFLRILWAFFVIFYIFYWVFRFFFLLKSQPF